MILKEKIELLGVLICFLVPLSVWSDELARSPGYPASHPDARLMPQVIENPGPEFADAFRLYQGIPGIERAPNGRLWAVWYGGGHGENRFNYIMLVTSENDGQTWSDLKLVIDSDGQGPVPDFDPDTWPTNEQINAATRNSGPRRVFDPVPWHDPDGRLWVFFAQERRTADDAPYRPAVTWAIVTKESGSENPEWSQPRMIAEGIMMNKPTALSTGEWLLPIAYWRGEPSAGVVVSRDAGQTFEFLGGASIFPERMRNVDEHMIVEREDDTLWMLVRTYLNRIGESVSEDRGKTWKPIEQAGRINRLPVSDGQLGHPNARFYVRRLSSGNILLVKHGAIGEVTRPRARLMAFLSEDEGRTWKGGLMLDERGGVSYPDGVESDDGVIYVVYDYERHGNESDSKSIHLARFKEDDILAGRPVSDESAFRLLVSQARGVNLRNYNISDNADGDDMSEPMTRWGLADMEPLNGEIDELESGVQLFAGRDEIVAFQIPPELKGRPFIRAERKGTRFRVNEPGLVFVLTPKPEREGFYSWMEVTRQFSQIDQLLDQGFRKASFPEVLLFPGWENIVSTYYKKVSEGEQVEFGEWGVVVF